MKTVSCLLLLCFAPLMGCRRPIRNGAIITGYREAACIPVNRNQGGTPTRTWDDVIATRGGAKVQISGARLPGGRIQLNYLADEIEIVAADAGDYVYPADVRLNQADDELFVKASGVTVFGDAQTWLFQFDLNKRIQSARVLVDPAVLPSECEAKGLSVPKG